MSLHGGSAGTAGILEAAAALVRNVAGTFEAEAMAARYYGDGT